MPQIHGGPEPWQEVYERLAWVGYERQGRADKAPTLTPHEWNDVLTWALIGQQLAGPNCTCPYQGPVSPDCRRHGKTVVPQ